MGTNTTIAKKYSKNAVSAKNMKEMAYIRNHFQNYIKEHAVYRNNSTNYPDYQTHIFTQVMEYTDGLFTLPQLYLLFIANCDDGIGWQYKNLSYYKMHVLEEIDNDVYESYDFGDIPEFCRKVMELNPIIFNILNELIYYSHLFWNKKDEMYGYPDMKEIESKAKHFNLKRKELTPEWFISKLSQTWCNDENGTIIYADNIADSNLIELGLNTLSVPFEKTESVNAEGKKTFEYDLQEDIELECLSLYKSMVKMHGNCKRVKNQAS
jgi:hypothetical protein